MPLLSIYTTEKIVIYIEMLIAALFLIMDITEMAYTSECINKLEYINETENSNKNE